MEAKKLEEKFALKYNQVKNRRERKCKEKEQVPKAASKKPGYAERSVDEIKDRYYSVSKALLEAKG